MDVELDQDRHPVPLMLLVALVQGFGLLLLHQSIELKFWPDQSPDWLFGFYSVVFSGPTLLLLALRRGRARQALNWILPFSLLLGGLGFYVGGQAAPLEHVSFGSLLFAFVLTMAMACFKALMYVQCYIQRQPVTYRQLFACSWRNFLTLSLSLLFTLCVWGVLMLWAGLFKAIELNFFYDLFTERWFAYPALALANGFGIVIFRRLSTVIDTITRLLQALMKFLLVLLSLVSLLFLAALPITGLAPLWASGGSFLILWMQALLLFFLNSVYQDDPEVRPYSNFFHRFIGLSIALLPVYSAISIYGLSLRVDQYGWSVMRLWATLIWLLLALFSVGYLVGIVRQRDNWLRSLSWVNVRLGLLLLGLLLLVNTPLLDFRKITVTSQVARLEAGVVSEQDFDIAYFRRHLASPGYQALQELAATRPALARRVKFGYEGRNPESDARLAQEVVAELSVRVPGEISMQPVSGALARAIAAELSSNRWRLQHNIAYYLYALDADADGVEDFLLVERQASSARMTLYYTQDGLWQKKTIQPAVSDSAVDRLLQALDAGHFSLAAPRWRELHIEGRRYQLQ